MLLSYNIVLATHATALVPNCNSFAVPLDQSVTWRRGTCYMGNSQSSIYHRPGIHPNLHKTHTDKTTLQTGEDTPASPCGVDTTREQQLPVISRRSIGVKQGARGCSRRWEGFRDIYRPPQAGQPPDRKVQSRHGLLSSLGAWGLGTIRKAARN